MPVRDAMIHNTLIYSRKVEKSFPELSLILLISASSAMMHKNEFKFTIFLKLLKRSKNIFIWNNSLT